MRIRRYAVTAERDDPDGVTLHLSVEDPAEWEGIPLGSPVILEVEDGVEQLVADLARYRGVLSEQAVGQLGELRPRLLDFLDRAAALAGRRATD